MSKKPLILSITALVLCIVMLMGTTFAWFTDTAKVSVNQIVSGTLDVTLVDAQGNSVENQTLDFIDKDKNIYWEPGCTYTLPDVFVKNNGNLALKYKIVVSGIQGDAKLNEAIEWTVTTGGSTYSADTEHHLGAWEKSDALTVKGHMKEDAGNDYMGLSINSIAITVYATQDTVESDSKDNQYDKNALYPEIPVDNLINATGKVDIETENNVTTADAAFNGGGVNVTVPAGVAVEEGKTELDISVSSKTSSDSNVNITENEKLTAYDVHVDGVATTNTKPIIVDMGEVLPKNLNSSAIKLNHIENGVSVPMTYVSNDQELTAHNQFKYDPATGHVTVALASFSEITVISDPTNPWDGTADKTWYNETDTEFTVRNAQQLAGLAQLVTAGNNFAGKTVKIAADINLTSDTAIFYPIGVWQDGNNFGVDLANTGAFSGTFDGMGHTISNLNQNGWSMNGNYSDGYYCGTLGLFGWLVDATVKNLNLDGFDCKMEFTYIGAVAGLAKGNCTFENIAVTNSDMWGYNTPTAGIVGCDDASDIASNLIFKNITVDATNTIHSLWGTWDGISGGILGYLAENSSANFDRCNVACVMDVYNDFCGNYQWGIYRYCGMFIGAVRKTTTDTETNRKICDLSNVTATNCAVNFGEWSKQYYYCEFEKNSMASYSPYYQFSRIPYEDVVFENGVAVGCQNHTHTENEKEHAWQFIFDAVFGSWGNWGVNPVDLEKYPAIKISDVTAADEKFTTLVTGTATAPYGVNEGDTVNVGTLFTAKSDVTINDAGVYVSVTKVNETDTVSGTYTADTTDWTLGTLTFTGTGTLKLTIQDYDFCTPTELYVNVTAKQATEKFELVFENTDKYLYRVGNSNTVALGSLFSAIDGVTINSEKVTVTVEKLDDATDVAGTFTANTTDRTKGTLQFTGTGPVKLTVTDNDACIATELLLEVVDGKNVTTAASATASNVILLNDVSGSFSVSNGYTFYGNGFEVTLPKEGHGASRTGTGFIGYINIDSGNLDNVQIVGPVYPEVNIFQNQAEQDGVTNYFKNAVIVNSGDCTITNSYISGGRANLYIKGGNDILIDNTTLSGGVYANIQIAGSKTVTLNNVTTIQKEQSDSYEQGKTLIGMGIVISEFAQTKLTLSGELNQYNWINKSHWDAMIPSTYQSQFPQIFSDSTYSEYWHYKEGDSSTKYVNVALISTYNWTDTNISDSHVGLYYKWTDVTLGSYNGGVYATVNAGTLTDALSNAPTYTPVKQGVPKPLITYGFNSSSQYVANTEGVSNYLYYGTDDGVVHIGVSSTSTTFDALNGVSVMGFANDQLTVSGTGFTNGKRTFTKADKGNGTITYSITSDKFYAPNGTKTGETVTYSYNLDYAVEAAEWKSATISVTPGTTYWYKGGSTLDPDYGACLPIYSGITIVDYEEDGTAVTVVSESDGKTKLDYVTYEVITNSSPTFANGCSEVTDSNTINYIQSTKLADNKADATYTVQFSYTGKNGVTVTTTATYTLSSSTGDLTSSSSSSGGSNPCITPETLITLADYSQVMAKDLTGNEQLLVWNHYTGSLDSAPVATIIDHYGEEYDSEIITLYFDNGENVEIVGNHVFFDITENKYVSLDADADRYIGHSFACLNENQLTEAKLIGVETEQRSTVVYEVVSYKHMNCFTNDMLSAQSYLDTLLNAFDFDSETLAYNAEQMAADIETYGLYTAEDFDGIMPVEAFEMYNMQNFKVSVGKSYITWEQILMLADIYHEIGVTPLN